jgi:hypothetical protein
MKQEPIHPNTFRARERYGAKDKNQAIGCLLMPVFFLCTMSGDVRFMGGFVVLFVAIVIGREWLERRARRRNLIAWRERVRSTQPDFKPYLSFKTAHLFEMDEQELRRIWTFRDGMQLIHRIALRSEMMRRGYITLPRQRSRFRRG